MKQTKQCGGIFKIAANIFLGLAVVGFVIFGCSRIGASSSYDEALNLCERAFTSEAGVIEEEDWEDYTYCNNYMGAQALIVRYANENSALISFVAAAIFMGMLFINNKK